MKRFVAITAALAILSGVLLKGAFVQLMIVICVGVFIAVPLAFFMALWAMIAIKRTGEIPEKLKTIFPVSVVISGGFLLSQSVSSAIHRWEVHQARSFVTSIVPRLDAYRTKHGIFPKSLNDIGVIQRPSLLSNDHGYSADSNIFNFVYWDDSSMMDKYCFDSESREWQGFD